MIRHNPQKRCHPHMFRNTFSVELLLSGVPIDRLTRFRFCHIWQRNHPNQKEIRTLFISGGRGKVIYRDVGFCPTLEFVLAQKTGLIDEAAASA